MPRDSSECGGNVLELLRSKDSTEWKKMLSSKFAATATAVAGAACSVPAGGGKQGSYTAFTPVAVPAASA